MAEQYGHDLQRNALQKVHTPLVWYRLQSDLDRGIAKN